jgi:hypothetical protein
MDVMDGKAGRVSPESVRPGVSPSAHALLLDGLPEFNGSCDRGGSDTKVDFLHALDLHNDW